MNENNWYQRYLLAIKEELTIKEIMKLRNVGQPSAIKIRKDALTYCSKNNIELPPRGTPTNAVLIVTNKNIDYYYKKMVQESNAKKLF